MPEYSPPNARPSAAHGPAPPAALVARSGWRIGAAYVVSVVGVLAVARLHLELTSRLGGRPMLIGFLIPITVGAFLGGLWPGVAGTAGAVFLALAYIFPSTLGPGGLRAADIVYVLLLALAGMIVSGLSEALFRLRRRDALALARLGETQRRLSAEQSILQATFENMVQGVMVTDASGTILRINPAGRRILGLSDRPEALSLARVPYQLVDDDGAPLPRDQWPSSRAARGDFSVSRPLHLRRTETGEIRSLVCSTSPVLTPGAEIQAVVITFEDTTKTVAQQLEIKRLSRLYATLSQVNQAIVRCGDREHLFDEICRVAINYGHFQGAWIAWKGPGDAGTKVVASNLADGIDRQRAGEALGQCSAVTRAIATGTSIAITNACAGCTSLVSDALRSRGRVMACAALPIRLRGAVVGGMGIMSMERDVFGPADMELLEETASDISFALDKLDEEEKGRASLERLRQSEATLAEGERIALMGSWERNVRENSIYWSEQIYRIYGREPHCGPASIEEVAQYYTPETWVDLKRCYDAVLSDGKPYQCTAQVTRPSGVRRWVIARGTGVRGSDGAIVGLKGTLQDVTELMDKEYALEESQARLHRLLEVAPFAMGIVAPDGKITFLNERFTHLFGYTIGDLPSLDVWWEKAYPNPDYRAWAKKTWFASTARAEPGLWSEDRTDYEVRCKDGSSRSIVAAGVNLGGTSMAAFYDVTGPKHAEAAMRERTAFFEAQFESSLDAILVVDGGGKVLFRNRRFVELFAVPEAMSASPSDAALLPFVTGLAKHPEKFRQRVEHLYANPSEVGRDEVDLIDGRFLDRYSAPVTDSRGRYYGRIWTFRDVTENHRLESQLLRAQRLEAIGTLSSGIAHDLNNILAPMLMATTLLRDEVHGGRGAELVSLMQSGAQRGANIIRQLLTFSRGIEGERVSVQLRHLVKDMVGIAKETFPRNITVTAEVSKDLHTVSADSTQLHQVLMNLCVNARDAMPNGGTLALAASNVRVERDGHPENPESRAGDYVLVRVSDTGMGIPEEHVEKIFDPFFTTKGLGKGTGLGLSTVLGIVRSHGGFVRVRSAVGAGAQFEVYLPAEAVEGPVQEVDSAVLPTKGNGQLILVVDDEAPIRRATRVALERWRYGVVEASNGLEALEAVRRSAGAVRLAIVDQMMPVMGGRDFIGALRNLDPQVKIIAVTGMEQVDQRAELQAMGASEVLIKPYSSPLLLEAVAIALSR